MLHHSVRRVLLYNNAIQTQKCRCEGTEKATRGGGEWESIKISRGNLSYVPNQTQCISLSTWSIPRSYERATSPQNRVRKPRITAEAQDEASKATNEHATVKTERHSFLLPHKHFIEHLAGNIEKPPWEYDKSEENSSHWSDGWRTIPTLTCNNLHQQITRKIESLDVKDKLEPECDCEQVTTITTTRWSLGQSSAHENWPKPRKPKNKGRLANRAARSAADKAHGKDRKLVGELLEKQAAEERSRHWDQWQWKKFSAANRIWAHRRRKLSQEKSMQNQKISRCRRTKKLLAKEKNPSGKDSARNLLRELRKSLQREARGIRTRNRSRPRSDSGNRTSNEEQKWIVQICHKKTSSGRELR
jgi:hypothetical protein